MIKEKIKNALELTRREVGLSRKYVSKLLGLRGTSALAAYERGVSWPPLLTALKLEIIYRKPVAFLYPEIYQAVRLEIRARETASSGEQQHD